MVRFPNPPPPTVVDHNHKPEYLIFYYFLMVYISCNGLFSFSLCYADLFCPQVFLQLRLQYSTLLSKNRTCSEGVKFTGGGGGGGGSIDQVMKTITSSKSNISLSHILSNTKNRFMLTTPNYLPSQDVVTYFVSLDGIDSPMTLVAITRALYLLYGCS